MDLNSCRKIVLIFLSILLLFFGRVFTNVWVTFDFFEPFWAPFYHRYFIDADCIDIFFLGVLSWKPLVVQPAAFFFSSKI